MNFPEDFLEPKGSTCPHENLALAIKYDEEAQKHARHRPFVAASLRQLADVKLETAVALEAA